jgi:hypothetical protein
MIAMARPERNYRALIATFLVLTLGAQIASLGVTIVRPGSLTAKLYPIIEYPMYARAHYDGERVIGRWLLKGVLANGNQIDITEQSLRVSGWDFILLTDQVALGKPGAPQTQRAIDTLVTMVKQRVSEASAIRELRIDNYPMKVTRHGAQWTASETVLSIPMAAPSDNGH